MDVLRAKAFAYVDDTVVEHQHLTRGAARRLEWHARRCIGVQSAVWGDAATRLCETVAVMRTREELCAVAVARHVNERHEAREQPMMRVRSGRLVVEFRAIRVKALRCATWPRNHGARHDESRRERICILANRITDDRSRRFQG